MRYLAGLLLLFGSAAAAETLPSPLRLVPNQADLVIQVEQPRLLADRMLSLEITRQLYQLEPFREQLDSTNARRFFQLVAYVEKQLGKEWPDILDQVAGGGSVVAITFEPTPASALLVLQGKDAKTVRQFVDLAVQVIEQELARQEAKERLEKGSYRKVETLRVGKDFHAAVAGTALIVSNKEAVLHRSVDLYLDGDVKSMAGVIAVADARKLLPPRPLAWAWLNLQSTVRQGKDGLDMLQQNPAIDAVVGHLLRIVRNSRFACAGLYESDQGFRFTVRLPSGRDVIPEHLAAGHLPPLDSAGTLPPLEPKGTLFSTSIHLDLSAFWRNRAKFLTADQLARADEFDAASGAFLAGHKLSDLLAMSGPYHRLVVASQSKTGYETAPGQRLPSFALVSTQRDPQFGKAMEAVLRAAAIAAGTQVKLRLVEEKHGDVLIIGYRFPENAKVAQDPRNLRFNYSPCFAAVGDQFIVAASFELCHALVDLIQEEARSPDRVKKSRFASHARLHGTGGAEVLKGFERQLYAQAVLGRAVPPAEAGPEIEKLLDWVRGLGTLDWTTAYGEQDFRLEVQWNLRK